MSNRQSVKCIGHSAFGVGHSLVIGGSLVIPTVLGHWDFVLTYAALLRLFWGTAGAGAASGDQFGRLGAADLSVRAAPDGQSARGRGPRAGDVAARLARPRPAARRSRRARLVVSDRGEPLARSAAARPVADRTGRDADWRRTWRRAFAGAACGRS